MTGFHESLDIRYIPGFAHVNRARAYKYSCCGLLHAQRHGPGRPFHILNRREVHCEYDGGGGAVEKSNVMDS